MTESTQPISVDFLTNQERDFCVGVSQGQDPKKVAVSLGMSVSAHFRLLKLPKIQNMLAVLKAQIERYTGTKVSRDLLTEMLFEAHATSGTSTEKIAAIRELGKMHGMYEAEKIKISNTAADKIEHLETLSDADLAERANLRLDLRNGPSEIYDREETTEIETTND